MLQPGEVAIDVDLVLADDGIEFQGVSEGRAQGFLDPDPACVAILDQLEGDAFMGGGGCGDEPKGLWGTKLGGDVLEAFVICVGDVGVYGQRGLTECSEFAFEDFTEIAEADEDLHLDLLYCEKIKEDKKMYVYSALYASRDFIFVVWKD